MKNSLQGAYSQRYSNYLGFHKEGRNDEVLSTPEKTPGPNFTVRVSYNSGMGNVAGNGLANGILTARSGDSVTLTATAKSGYHFVKWCGLPTGKEATSPTLTFTVFSNTSVSAVFAADLGAGATATDDHKITNQGGFVISPQGGGSTGAAAIEDVVPPTTASGLKATLKKYWWVLAIIAGWYLYKEGKL